MGNYSPAELTAMAVATFGAVGISAISLLEVDYFSRSFLSSPSLQQKRLESYKFQWEQESKKSLTKTLGPLRYLKSKLLNDDDDILKIFQSCMEVGKCQVLAIGIDDSSSTQDVCVWLLFSDTLYQIPIQQMAPIISKLIESLVFTNTLCFVADASGGLGLKIVKEVLKSCQPSIVSVFAFMLPTGYNHKINAKLIQSCCCSLL